MFVTQRGSLLFFALFTLTRGLTTVVKKSYIRSMVRRSLYFEIPTTKNKFHLSNDMRATIKFSYGFKNTRIKLKVAHTFSKVYTDWVPLRASLTYPLSAWLTLSFRLPRISWLSSLFYIPIPFHLFAWNISE